MSFDSLVNRGDYFSAHYLAEVLPKDLKRKDGLLARWTEQEKNGRETPRRGLRALGKRYFEDRPFLARLDQRLRDGDALDPDDLRERRKRLAELHGDVLRALGFDARPRELTVTRADEDHPVQVAYADQYLVAVECGWAADVDAALDDTQSGLLTSPVAVGREEITSGTKLASWLFNSEPKARYVLLLAGGVVILADRAVWGEGRFLAVSLDIALGRKNPAELETIAALFGADSLLPPEEGGAEPLAELLTNSRNHAVGVSKELRDGLKESVELIANEVLDRIRAHGAQPEQVMDPGVLAKELSREALRYLYRILFLLYAEARPELGILPTDDKDYTAGYSLARLGDLVVRDLVGEEARSSFHLYESLDLLCRMVNKGHRPRTGDEVSDGEGLRFEPLRSDLFEPTAIKLIGRTALVMPGYDEDDPSSPRIDTRLRNEALYKVLRKLMITKGRRKERGGFISYAQLGINQLGAVYEGLMSYTGFIATEELYEVAKGGDPSGGSWMIPASKVNDYSGDVFVLAADEDGVKTEAYVRYPQGSFVYRLAGRDRETSASYYTPESLTQVTVQLALQHRLDQDGTTTSAREILGWKICEPALGSGAFLNEAIKQVAGEYLRRREAELGATVDPDQREIELQRAKAYIALHNSYGVDLNDTAIELAEVSVWLNVMHPGLQAPWFGLHLRRGNSLIGAGRRVYEAAQLTKGGWLKTAPTDVPFSAGDVPIGRVHHFLVPAEGWGAVAGAKEAKELAPTEAKKLGAWRKQLRKNVSDKKTLKRGDRKVSQLDRLQALSGRAEFLWNLVNQRLAISEREISRKIEVWGADWIDQPPHAVPKEKVYGDLTAPGTPYWRLKMVMDAWCGLWFWPLDMVGLLDGTDPVYARVDPKVRPVPDAPGTPAAVQTVPDPVAFPGVYVTESLFSSGQPEQLGLDQADETLDKSISELRAAANVTATKTARTGSRKAAIEPQRPVVPLANLDDWLDFAEAVLGRADASEDTLGPTFESLDDLERFEDELPAWMAMDSENRLAERFPWLDAVEDLADQHGFFHWELQFAQIFTRGGFDLQVGNPPWVRPRWVEAPILAEIDPWFMLAGRHGIEDWRERRDASLSDHGASQFFRAELASVVGMLAFIGSTATYPLLEGTQPDLSRAFMVRVWANLGEVAAAGLLHPDTHFGGIHEGPLRAAAYRHLRVHGGFVNVANWAFDAGRTLDFGVHIYGAARAVDFLHLSQLYSANVLSESLVHDGRGQLPGQKYEGAWDRRPHQARVIQVNTELLKSWQKLTGDGRNPIEQAPLLQPITTAEASAIAALAAYGYRLGTLSPWVSRGHDEPRARAAGLIRYAVGRPTSLQRTILQGGHIGIATPFFKEPNDPFRNGKDWRPYDLISLPESIVPRTTYAPGREGADYQASHDLWGDGRYTDYYRLAWRSMIDPKSTERSLFAAILPPGPTHVHAVYTLAVPGDDRATALAAGFWASLPLDYLLRIAGRTGLLQAEALAMPGAMPHHPLASGLLVRALRLNCLTNAYEGLWSSLYEEAWRADSWVVSWRNIKPLVGTEASGPAWHRETPLRGEYERRAALVEIDSLVAVWLGLEIEQLIAIYRARYSILSGREASMWFDANGRRISADPYAFGYGQTREHFQQLMGHLDPELNGPVPQGYAAPFYKADREAEYRQAHAVFAERLRRAKADGWTPEGGRG